MTDFKDEEITELRNNLLTACGHLKECLDNWDRPDFNAIKWDQDVLSFLTRMGVK